MWDKHSNCYTLHSKGINGKLIENWNHIDLEGGKLAVIQQLLNEYATSVGNNSGNITLKLGSDTRNYTFKIGDIDTTYFSDGTNTYNLSYDVDTKKITVTKSADEIPSFEIDTSKNNPTVINRTINEIKKCIKYYQSSIYKCI